MSRLQQEAFEGWHCCHSHPVAFAAVVGNVVVEPCKTVVVDAAAVERNSGPVVVDSWDFQAWDRGTSGPRRRLHCQAARRTGNLTGFGRPQAPQAPPPSVPAQSAAGRRPFGGVLHSHSEGHHRRAGGPGPAAVNAVVAD